MKKVWLIGLILFLTGCSLINVNPKTYTIEFDSNGGSSITSIDAREDEVLDLNQLYIPNRTHYLFDGWFYDELLSSPYNKDQIIDSDLTLYAKWNPAMYEITFNFNIDDEVESVEFEYQSTIEFPTFELTGYEISYWYESDMEVPFIETVMPGRDLTLYAKWEKVIEYHTVQFELNGGSTVIADILIQDGFRVTEPIKPVKEGYIFVGWFSDSSLETLYDFEALVTSDITIYAKWQAPHDVGEIVYEIDGDLLKWEAVDEALFFDVYLGDDMEDPISVINPEINLKPYEGLLENSKNTEVYVIFEYGESYLILDLVLQYKNLNEYNTGFEATDGFVATTTYNNQSPKLQGNTNNQFSILSGSVSTTQPITENQSLQLRYYTTNPNTYGYAQNEFPLSDVHSLTFTAKSTTQHVMVSYSTDNGATFKNEVTYPLTAVAQQFSYSINMLGPIKIRFTLVKISSTNSSSLTIDDLVIYSLIGDKTLVELIPTEIDTYPETDEVALAGLKSQYESQRSSLPAPQFAIPMSNQALLDYYATLNGMSGLEFKTELRNILTLTHVRKSSYDEARFILEQSDLITDNEGRQYLDGVYSGTKIVKYWDGGATWSREHIWPNSRLGMERVEGSDRNQGSDVHNLRAINPSVNGSRSNRYYDNGLSALNGLVGNDAYYPGDQYKGDVARIIFYMVARYDFLILRDDNIDAGATYTLEGAIMGKLSVLIDWHNADPVDAFEVRRNDVIYSYQGNRNPFIDHPEYVGIYYAN